MKELKEVIAEQASQTLPRLFRGSSEIILSDSQGSYVSAYSGVLTQEGIVEGVLKIKATFPSLPKEFFAVLSSRVKARGFTNERFIDAVEHVIDTCIYPTPTVANFISFDRKVRLFTYHEMVKKVNEAGGDGKLWDYYEKREVGGKTFWASKADKK